MKKILIVLSILMISATSKAAIDSTITPQSGIAGITATSDTTSDTFRLKCFVEIEPVAVMDAGTANLLTVAMEEGDFSSYVIVRYNLLDSSGKLLYSNRYRISGSCYSYLMSHGIGYVFWKICNEKGFTLL